jgi:YbbR domain-containing protein
VTLQLLSLAFAVVLWYAIAGQKTAERGLEVPVELLSVPRDLELTGDPVNTLAVRLRGSPGIIRAIEPGEVSAEIDLAGAAEGERIVHLTEASIRAPFGVKVVKISPSMLTLSFERTAERILPVRPRLIGRPAPGFEVADVTSQPAEVLVSGPRSRVQEIESAFTEPVSIDGADTTLVQSLAVGLEDPLLRLQGTSRVRVTARIREVQEQRSFDGLRVGARGGAARVEPATVRVVLSGPASVLRGLDRGDVEAYVTTGPDGAAARRVPVAVEIASGHAGVSVVETVPAEVTIRAPRTGGTR